MLEADFSKNEGWNEMPGGRTLLRTHELPSGAEVTEQIQVSTNIKRVAESYGDLYRQYWIFGEPKDDFARKVQKTHKQLSTYSNSIGFLDEKGRLQTLVFSSRQNHIGVSIIDPQEIGDWFPPILTDEKDDLVSVIYDSDGIDRATFQAEIFKSPDKREWVDPLRSLMDFYPNEADRTKKFREFAGYSSLDYSRIVEELGDENPLVQDANNVVSRIIEAALSKLPEDDKEKGRLIVEEIGLSESLANVLIDRAQLHNIKSIDEVIRRIYKTEDEYMHLSLSAILDDLSGMQARNYRRFLRINKFGEKGFSWAEVEVGEVEVMEYNDDRPLETVKVMQRGESEYGRGVAIQDSTFALNIANSIVTVNCLASNNQPRWKASFPSKIPFEEIKKALDDPNEDFRKIKQLYTATFDLQSKSQK